MTGHPTRICLGLQGGGAHGAFTWGALERLSEEPALTVAGISGTSAGALNGAAWKAGWLADGAAGARDALGELWGRVGAVRDLRMGGWMAPWRLSPGLTSDLLEASPVWAIADAASRLTSPYALGPFWRNPLEPVVRDLAFDRVCAKDGPALFIGATNVRTGKPRVFTGTEITKDAILASACLPTMFQAVEIDGPETGQREAYWDGGYSGNPPLFPLLRPDLPDDLLIISLNPLRRDAVPRNPQDIQNRINEISFNAALLRDLRAIEFVHQLMDEGALVPGRMKRVRVHVISDDALMNDLSVATKSIPTRGLLTQLRAAGRAAADGFLRDHGDKIGHQSSVDLAALYG